MTNQQIVIVPISESQQIGLKRMGLDGFTWQMTLTPFSDDLLTALRKRADEMRVIQFEILSGKFGVVLVAAEPLNPQENQAARELLKQIVMEEAARLRNS